MIFCNSLRCYAQGHFNDEFIWPFLLGYFNAMNTLGTFNCLSAILITVAFPNNYFLNFKTAVCVKTGPDIKMAQSTKLKNYPEH